MTSQERRVFQRLKLAKPILGTMDAHSALILDIGVAGAFIEHRGRAMDGLRLRLAFRWQGEEIAYDAEVVRSEVVRQGGEEGVVSHSAVNFVKAHGDAEVRLEQMMATFVGHVLAAYSANASAAPSSSAEVLDQIGQARRTRSRGLISYRWDGKRWTHKSTMNPKQPEDGFTVAAYEDEEELAVLCQTYEAADEEARRMIRLVAELSVRAATR